MGHRRWGAGIVVALAVMASGRNAAAVKRPAAARVDGGAAAEAPVAPAAVAPAPSVPAPQTAELQPPSAPDSAPIDPTLLGGVGVAIVGILVARSLLGRRRHPVQVEIELDDDADGSFIALLLSGRPEQQEAITAALAALPEQAFTRGVDALPPPLRALVEAHAALRGPRVQLGQASTGKHRVAVFGKVFAKQAGTGAPAPRTFVQDRAVLVLDAELTLRFDARQSSVQQGAARGRPAEQSGSSSRGNAANATSGAFRRNSLSTTPAQPLQVGSFNRTSNPGSTPARPVGLGLDALPNRSLTGRDSGPAPAVGPAPAATGGDDLFRAPQQAPSMSASAELGAKAVEAFKSGDYEKAASFYRQLGDRTAEARCWLFLGREDRVAELDAQVALEANDFNGAINAYLRAKQLPQAAKLLRKLTRNVEAARLEAQILSDGGKPEEAAALLEQEGEFARAGELLAEAGKNERALVLLEKAGAFDTAARVAARIGDLSRAATFNEQAGKHAEAAVLLLKLQRPVEALAAAQRVPEGDDGWLLAATVQARCLRAAGNEQGLAQLAAAAGRANVRSAGHRDALVALGLFFSQGGLREGALACFDRAAASDPSHPAAEHGRQLRSQLGASADGARRRAQETMAEVDAGATQGPVGAPSSAPNTAAGELPASTGRYQVEAELGRGAMGIVYRATDTLLGRPVALKTLPPAYAATPLLRRMFMEEARSLAALNHPHVVQIYDLGELGSTLFLAMELLEGQSLEKVLEAQPMIPRARVIEILDQLAQALHAAHQRGITHRDVKPANIAISPTGLVKLMDFGIASGEAGGAGQKVGTPLYMAPEQIRGEAVDGRADLYATGVMAYRLLTGRFPFVRDDVLEQHLKEMPPAPRSIRPDLPAEDERLLAGLLAKDRTKRIPSAEALRQALAALPR